MDKDDLLNLVNDPNLIPGIYNYCDQWCERCTFTKRCANFAINEKRNSERGELDISNKEFWKELESVFKLTLDMLLEAAQNEGIDLNAIDYTVYEKTINELDIIAENSPCSSMSKDYIDMVEAFFETAESTFKEWKDEQIKMYELGISGVDAERNVEKLSSLIEVISWYRYQIHVKINRALMGKLEDEDVDFSKDSDGSAKVALIGIDRSISAYGKILLLFPQLEDELLKILIHLEKLRKVMEKGFPEARSFIRPGFDEIK